MGFWDGEPDRNALIIREPTFLLAELDDEHKRAVRAAERDRRFGIDRSSRLYLRLRLPLDDAKAERLAEYCTKLKSYTEKIIRAIYEDERTIDRYLDYGFLLPELHAEAIALIRDWSVIVESDGSERPTLMTDMMRLSRDELCDIMFELMRDGLYPTEASPDAS